MSKGARQSQILRVIRAKRVHTQEELARELREAGIQATQVTLSRDVRELRLVKTAAGYQELPADAEEKPELATLASEFLLEVRVAQNLVVLKTTPATANSLASVLDQQQWDEVVGTVAGDDTILVIAPSAEAAELVRERLEKFV